MLEDQLSHEYTELAAGAVMEREQIRVGKLTFAMLQRVLFHRSVWTFQDL